MSVEVVREVADVERVAVELGLTPVSDGQLGSVYGRWDAAGVSLSAIWCAPRWVTCAVQARGQDGRLAFIVRFEGAARIADVRGQVEFALASHASQAVAA